METRANPAQTWRFGVFEVDARNMEMRRGGTPVKIREQSFTILVFLLEHAGELVTREDLRRVLWPSDTFVDFDHSLNAAVMKLREALGDSADTPLYIETIPKRGYRFIAPLSRAADVPKELPEDPLSKPEQRITSGRDADLPPPTPVLSPVETAEAKASTRPPFRQPLVFIGAIALVALAAGVSWFFARRGTTNRPLAEQRITSNSPDAPIRVALVSPDGKYVAYADPTGLYLRQIATGETRRWALPKDFIANPSSWFPDGIHLLARHIEGSMQTPSLWKLSLLGADPRKLIDNAGPGWVSPDGSRIAFLHMPGGHELWVMGSDGSNPHKIADAGKPEPPSFRESVIYPLVWSPNGQRIAYIERHRAPVSTPVEDVFSSLRTSDANGGDLHVILNDRRLGQALTWAPDGRVLFAYREDAAGDRGDEGLRSIRVDERTGKAIGQPQFVTDGAGSIGGMSVTSDGKRLVLWRENTQSQVFIAELDANARKWKIPRRLTLDANGNVADAWMPDGRTVLFFSNRNGTWTLFKQRIDETTAEVLVEGLNIFLPRLSADGSQVIYESRADPANFSVVSLMRLPIAGGPPKVVLQETGITNYQCARPPSTLCIFSKLQGTDHIFVSFDPERGIGRELLRTNGGFNNWTLSPDGGTLAIFPGDYRIRFFSVENGAARESNTVTLNDWRIQNGDWSADGKGVLVPSLTPTGTPVMLEVDRAGKASVVLEGAANTTFYAMVPSPDGRYGILDVNVPGDNNAWMVDKF